jgi:hypothetical protein
MLRRTIAIVLIAWLSFWWGHYFGGLDTTQDWVASERDDFQALSLLKRLADTDGGVATALAAQVAAKKAEVDQLEEASTFSLTHFVLFPALGPFRRIALAWL